MKFSVMVEEADLLHMLAERGADDPEKIRGGMLNRDVYRVMDAEAMVFVFDTLHKQAGEGTSEREDAVTKGKAAFIKRNQLLDKYVSQQPAE
jgi:hypothetical protein